jgi:hypothetical protein
LVGELVGQDGRLRAAGQEDGRTLVDYW